MTITAAAQGAATLGASGPDRIEHLTALCAADTAPQGQTACACIHCAANYILAVILGLRTASEGARPADGDFEATLGTLLAVTGYLMALSGDAYDSPEAVEALEAGAEAGRAELAEGERAMGERRTAAIH